MRTSARFGKLLQDAKASPTYWAERVMLDFTSQLWVRLKQLGWTQKDLADKVGKKQPYVSRVLNGNHNATVETLVTLAHAAGLEVKLSLESLDSEKVDYQNSYETLIVPIAKVTRPRLVHTTKVVLHNAVNNDEFMTETHQLRAA